MGLRKAIILAFVRFARLYGRFALRGDRRLQLLLAPGFERARWRIGAWKAWYVLEQARRDVPAYRAFTQTSGYIDVPFRGWDPDLSVVQETNKENYVKRFRIEERCTGGAFPSRGVMIDESSGTSGKPNNWVRGPDERWAVKKVLQIAMRHRFGAQPFFAINAFALGPWATGMNVSMSVLDIAILKSTGPELEKIQNTLRDFGPSYRYIVFGYPPFLKALADQAIDWKRFDVTVIFGGEGISEEMRDYLLEKFRAVYGSYGASDLEINLAAENDFTIWLRRRMAANPALRARLVRVPSTTLPMVFQYNPLDYYIETNPAGELVVTLGRLSNISPKVRYNIRDLGHVVRPPELRRILQECAEADANMPEFLDLPVLFHYGRSDMSVAFYGSKIVPAEIESILYGLADVAPHIQGFALLVAEDERSNKRLTIAIERSPTSAPNALATEGLADRILTKLQLANQDFRESSRMIPAGLEPTVKIFGPGEGPFAGQDPRVKRRYIQSEAKAAGVP